MEELEYFDFTPEPDYFYFEELPEDNFDFDPQEET